MQQGITPSGGLRVYLGHLQSDLNAVDAVSHCHKRVQGILSLGRNAKVGITGNPTERARDPEYCRRYSVLEPLWATQSLLAVETLEQGLTQSFPQLDNVASGGGGNIQGPPYCLYVVH